MNFPEDGYRTMICSFRTNDLQTLLAAFNRNKNGRKSELKERALELLSNRPIPTGFNYSAYLTKISEIFRAMQQNDVQPNNDVMRNMMNNHRQIISITQQQAQQTQQRMFQPPPYQQTMHISRSGLPQVMPQMQRGMYGSNITANNTPSNNNMQYTYQTPTSRNIVSQVPPTIPISMGTQNSLRYDLNSPATGNNNNNAVNPSLPSLVNVKFKKLPFYEVVAEVVKPTALVGQERCTLPNFPKATSGMREATIKLIMLLKHINLISGNRDISNGKSEYPYQIQIRICLLETGSTEISDFLPLGLNVRVGNKSCILPPTTPNNRPGIENRRIARPVNCSNLLKLNPTVINPITINWLPDGKTYVMGMYLIQKLSADTLLQRLKDKGSRSSEETKNYIIKKLADVDPDLATTSYRFSLVCPLGKMRMKIPAKSINCDHLQCFDASIFILMNEKKPTWMCPTCNKSCVYDDIQIESYFLEIVTSPDLPDCCKEIEILADGTWRVYKEVKDIKQSADTADIANKEKQIDSVNLDSDDGNDEPMEPKKEVILDGPKENENLKSFFIDLTLSDDEEQQPSKEKDKQENEAQAADAVQSVTTVDLKPQAQVQPQQAVTSSEQGVVIEIDSPSPPTSPPPECPIPASPTPASSTPVSPTPASPTPTTPAS